MTHTELHTILKQKKLSGSAAARKLEISERMMRYYLSGTKPIPRKIELALRGIE